MPLNLQPSDGEFTPYIKYNSKAGRWYVKGPEGGDTEVINPRLAFDMANIKTGWIMFSEGMGPITVWDVSSTEMAPKPEGKYKRGFNVMVCGGDNLPDIGVLGLREFSSTANVVITAMLDMYRRYEEEVTAHPSQVPFYQCTGVKPISGMHGTNYEPQFQLVGWVERAKVPVFDEHLRSQSPQAQTGMTNGNRDVFPPPGVSKGMPDAPPDMSAHGGPGPQPSASHGLDDEIPFSPCIY